MDGRQVTTITDSNLLDKIRSGELKLGYERDGKDHDDVNFAWKAEVEDPISGDQQIVTGGKNVVYDAVADGSDLDAMGFAAGDQSGDYVAVQSGETAKVTITTSFKDTQNTSEEHWVVLEQVSPDYKVESVTVTGSDGSVYTYGPDAIEIKYDANGTPYYAVKMPGQGDYTVVFNVRTPQVDVDTKSPPMNAGSITIETSRTGDGNVEPDLSNNWKADIKEDAVIIETGVVDTKKVTASADDGNALEVQPGDGPLSIGIEITPEGGQNDAITKVTLTPADPTAGDFYYKGEKLVPGNNGKIVIDDPDFDTNELTFRPNETWSGSLKVKVEAEVEDTQSGAKADKSYGANLVIEVEAVATAPTDPTAQSSFDPQDGGVWTLTLSAAYADIDGSENHFFLVQLSLIHI